MSCKDQLLRNMWDSSGYKASTSQILQMVELKEQFYQPHIQKRKYCFIYRAWAQNYTLSSSLKNLHIQDNLGHSQSILVRLTMLLRWDTHQCISFYKAC